MRNSVRIFRITGISAFIKASKTSKFNFLNNKNLKTIGAHLESTDLKLKSSPDTIAFNIPYNIFILFYLLKVLTTII
jgi:hypothetical protein